MLRLFKIAGDSLAPEYQDGDFVFVSKIPFLFHPASPGDIVAFHQPGYGLLIKRVQQTTPENDLDVGGSRTESIDSRVFGPVRRNDLLGKVIWHIRKP